MAILAEEPDQLGAPGVWDGLRRLAVLPEWLSVIAGPARVAAALREQVPELAAGEQMLHACRVDRIRLKDDHWTALYDLTVTGPGAAGEREVRLSGTLRPPGQEEAPPAGNPAP